MTAKISWSGLVVDDDFDVRSFVSAVLTADGDTVLSAGDPLEALRLARASREPIDFLVTDFDLGAATGLDLAAAVRRTFPHIRVLLISGSIDCSTPPVSDRVDGFLQKPFTATELRTKLANLLAEPQMAEHAG